MSAAWLRRMGPLPLLRRIRSMLCDRRGVAAIEFAFVVPVLLCMYFITMEASQGIEVNKKVSRIGSTVGDLITQQTSISKDEIVAIMDIGKSIVRPYNRSVPRVEVTAIQFDGESTPVARVFWSVKLNSSGEAQSVAPQGTIINDPQLTKLRAKNAFYIRVKATLDYKPVIAWSAETNSIGLLSAFSNITMGETFYLRPRLSSSEIKCEDCFTK